MRIPPAPRQKDGLRLNPSVEILKLGCGLSNFSQNVLMQVDASLLPMFQAK